MAFFLGTAIMCAGVLSAEWQRLRLSPESGTTGIAPRAAADIPHRARTTHDRGPDNRSQSAIEPAAQTEFRWSGKEAGRAEPPTRGSDPPLGTLRREPDGRPDATDHEGEAGGPRASGADAEGAPVFRNTYYHLTEETSGAKEASLFDAACSPIAAVPASFHDDVCVQGSGRLATGQVVSFAVRDCACAAVCPRTGQRICFERLDPKAFPFGRGAMGTPVVPLRTAAVDSDVIPLGSTLFIPEAVGLPTMEGGEHDGCFVAEDRGIQIRGRHIDIFTGTAAMMAKWNDLFPSNKGAHVVVGSPKCRAHEADSTGRRRRLTARR